MAVEHMHGLIDPGLLYMKNSNSITRTQAELCKHDPHISVAEFWTPFTPCNATTSCGLPDSLHAFQCSHWWRVLRSSVQCPANPSSWLQWHLMSRQDDEETLRKQKFSIEMRERNPKYVSTLLLIQH